MYAKDKIIIDSNKRESNIEKMSSIDIFFVYNIICQTQTKSVLELKRDCQNGNLFSAI